MANGTFITLEEDESKDGEEVDEDEGEDECEDDGAQVARDCADHVLERLLPEDHFHQLNDPMITVGLRRWCNLTKTA